MTDDVGLEEALLRVDDCERRGEPILGLEWFFRQSRTIIPAGIADFSSIGPRETWAEARRLLAAGIPDGADTVEIVTSEFECPDSQSGDSVSPAL